MFDEVREYNVNHLPEDVYILSSILKYGTRRSVEDSVCRSKKLLSKFGSLNEVINAPKELLEGVLGRKCNIYARMSFIRNVVNSIAKSKIYEKGKIISASSCVIQYTRARIGFLEREVILVIFLNKRNYVISDEVFGIGTVDTAPLYPREVIKRALTLNATALILVHNHPSGDTTPSQADISLTRQIVAGAKPLGIEVQDHIVVGRTGHSSLRKLRMM